MTDAAHRPADETAPAEPPGPAPAEGMRWVPGGTFLMGSEEFYPEEGPVHPVHVDGFWMDEHPVTVAQFRRFVRATGHVTLAERTPTADDYPDADPDLLVPGSLVFTPTSEPVPLDDNHLWWRYVPGARWDRPEGPQSDAYTRGRHPVVHVGWEDAVAYAAWAGKQLPTEAEWERAARGGLEGRAFTWGDEDVAAGELMANRWYGEFPWQHDRPDEWLRTSPVGTYPPNGYGLRDMAGNVWEWTADWFVPEHPEAAAKPCCVPRNPRVAEPLPTVDGDFPRRVIKGGSHLCSPSYCFRYRPAARQAEAIDTSTGHIGFRCIVRPS